MREESVDVDHGRVKTAEQSARYLELTAVNKECEHCKKVTSE